MGIGSLVIRADASPEIGTGHVMRCLALAQEWKERGGRASFVTGNWVGAVNRRLEFEEFPVWKLHASASPEEDALQTTELLRKLSPDWVVVDGYSFSLEYLSMLRESGTPIALVDDHGTRGRYDVDLVINPNIFASPQMYPLIGDETRVLAGPQFALLRREFRNIQRNVASASSAKKSVLITLGGSDPDNVSLLILQALDQGNAENLEIIVLCGAANRHVPTLQKAAQVSRHRVCVLVDVSDMTQLLSSVGMAISAPGATALEFAALQVPMLLVTIAANHVRTAEAFAARECASSVGWYHALEQGELAKRIESFLNDATGRSHRATIAARCVDLLGAARVVNEMIPTELAVSA